jgi:hypothetical protein
MKWFIPILLEMKKILFQAEREKKDNECGMSSHDNDTNIGGEVNKIF